MKNSEYLKRHLIIIDYLKYPKSFKEIKDKLEEKSKEGSGNYEISIRTFQRDVKEIEKIHQVKIKYNRSLNQYSIVNSNTEQADKIMQNLDTLHILNLSNRFSKFIQFEKRKYQNHDNFKDILVAIEKRKVLSFYYKNTNDEEPIKRKVEPYIIKEFKNRWYLVAKDLNDKNLTIKSFALDLLSIPMEEKEKFTYPNKAEIDEKFKNYFGIDTYPGGESVEIMLSVANTSEYFNQADYIQTMPLHYTQKIISKTEKETIFKLKLFPSEDFKRDLLYFGNKVKVIKPAKLAKDIAKMHRLAFENY